MCVRGVCACVCVCVRDGVSINGYVGGVVCGCVSGVCVCVCIYEVSQVTHTEGSCLAALCLVYPDHASANLFTFFLNK